MDDQIKMRRKDREVTDPQIINDIINRAEVIHIGMYDGKQPYIVPLNYGYLNTNGHHIFYMHCAIKGRKIDILKEFPEVCFELDIDRTVRTNPKACGWTMFFKSIMGYGKVEIVNDPDERTYGLSLLMDHYNPDGISKPYDFSHLIGRTIILKLKVESLTCKVKGTKAE
jgi:nitroimidazol reductase NimA-like FMN-containing flavoprotein (pyridoxamine 5'-phosphate oxidase superfamily)